MSQMHYEWKLPSPIFGRMLLDVVMEMNISLVYRKDFAAWSLVSLCSSRYLSYSRCPLKGRPFAVTFIFSEEEERGTEGVSPLIVAVKCECLIPSV